jgi:putative transposase
MCQTLDVSASGYYLWRDRTPSLASQRRDLLIVQIKTVHQEVKARYGSPRIHAELVDRGHGCCVNTVAKLMRQAGIAAKTVRKFRCTTDSNHRLPVAVNVLDRQFLPATANEAWVADITYVWTAEGWLYLAAVEDLYSRRVVGWAMGAEMISRLVVDALEMAVKWRLPGEGLVAHSDRGSQYASEHYQRLLARHGIECSMSGRGDCWDNAPMESFFATLLTVWTLTTSALMRSWAVVTSLRVHWLFVNLLIITSLFWLSSGSPTPAVLIDVGYGLHISSISVTVAPPLDPPTRSSARCPPPVAARSAAPTSASDAPRLASHPNAPPTPEATTRSSLASPPCHAPRQALPSDRIPPTSSAHDAP